MFFLTSSVLFLLLPGILSGLESHCPREVQGLGFILFGPQYHIGCFLSLAHWYLIKINVLLRRSLFKIDIDGGGEGWAVVRKEDSRKYENPTAPAWVMRAHMWSSVARLRSRPLLGPPVNPPPPD